MMALHSDLTSSEMKSRLTVSISCYLEELCLLFDADWFIFPSGNCRGHLQGNLVAIVSPHFLLSFIEQAAQLHYPAIFSEVKHCDHIVYFNILHSASKTENWQSAVMKQPVLKLQNSLGKLQECRLILILYRKRENPASWISPHCNSEVWIVFE